MLEQKQYDFIKSLPEGEERERILDDYYSKWFKIKKVSMEIQKSGVDRIFTHPDGYKFTVEYKGDNRGHETGNVFIETVSVDTNNTLGWAYTACAQVLYYWIMGLHTVYIMDMMRLKRILPLWIDKYGDKIKSIENDGYYTKGFPIPISVFEKDCVHIDNRVTHEKDLD